MKNKLFYSLCLGLLLWGASAFKLSTEGEKEFIMCIVQGDYTQQQGFDIAKEFKTQYPATSACRLDGVSKKFFIVFEKEKITKDQVIDFFAAKHFKATCLYKGVQGVDQVPDLSAAECK